MMQISKIFILLILSIECLSAFELRVPTSAPHNAEAVFHVRVPKGYDTSVSELCRVMVYFGGRNVSGEKEAEGHWGGRSGATRTMSSYCVQASRTTTTGSRPSGPGRRCWMRWRC